VRRSSLPRYSLHRRFAPPIRVRRRFENLAEFLSAVNIANLKHDEKIRLFQSMRQIALHDGG